LEDAQEKLDETVEYYQKMIAVGDEHPKVNIGLAGVYAIRGEKQEAYRWLERAIEGGFLEYRYLERHPFFANLHGDPRFQQMMAGVKQEADGILGRVREMEKEWGWE